jgi:hypothetical protein
VYLLLLEIRNNITLVKIHKLLLKLRMLNGINSGFRPDFFFSKTKNKTKGRLCCPQTTQIITKGRRKMDSESETEIDNVVLEETVPLEVKNVNTSTPGSGRKDLWSEEVD